MPNLKASVRRPCLTLSDTVWSSQATDKKANFARGARGETTNFSFILTPPWIVCQDMQGHLPTTTPHPFPTQQQFAIFP